MQNTITLEYKGETIVSKPFTFGIACIIDDGQYKGDGLATSTGKAMIKMFEGTIITDKVIDSMEIDFKSLKTARDEVLDLYLKAINSIKN